MILTPRLSLLGSLKLLINIHIQEFNDMAISYRSWLDVKLLLTYHKALIDLIHITNVGCKHCIIGWNSLHLSIFTIFTIISMPLETLIWPCWQLKDLTTKGMHWICHLMHHCLSRGYFLLRFMRGIIGAYDI